MHIVYEIILARCEGFSARGLASPFVSSEESRATRRAHPLGLGYASQLVHEAELIVVDVALRNLALLHLVHDARSKLDSFPRRRNRIVSLLLAGRVAEAIAKRAFVRTSNQEFHAHPVPLSQTSHALPREIGQGFCPRLESSLDRFTTLHWIGQVGYRHDDVIHVESPQVVPVSVVDRFKRRFNHAKVLLDRHSLTPLLDRA